MNGCNMVSLSDLESGYFTYFNEDTGIFIGDDSDVLVLYEKFGKEWDSAEFKRNEIASIETISIAPSQINSFGRTGVGEAIGIAIKNDIDRNAAASQSGIRVLLKDIQLPPFFLRISDPDERDVAKRALGQFINDDMHGSFTKIPSSIKSYFNAKPAQAISEPKISSGESANKSSVPWIAISFVIAFVGFIIFILSVD